MYIEVKTNSSRILMSVLRRAVEEGKATRISLDKPDELWRLSLSQVPDEASDAIS